MERTLLATATQLHTLRVAPSPAATASGHSSKALASSNVVGTEVAYTLTEHPLRQVSWNRSGHALVGIQPATNDLWLFDRRGEHTDTLRVPRKLDDNAGSTATTPATPAAATFCGNDGRWVVAVTAGDRHLWAFDRSIQSWEYMTQLPVDDGDDNDSSLSIDMLRVSSDHSLVVAARSFGRRVSVHDRLANTTRQLKWVPADNAHITALQCSGHRRSLLSVGCDDGSVYLVDCVEDAVRRHFPRHHASGVADLAFSPFNRYLMVSCGGSMFTLFDVEKQMAVRTVTTDSPLTRITFRHDGVVLAMGTRDGHVLFFDLATGAKRPCADIVLQKDGLEVSELAFRCLLVANPSSQQNPMPKTPFKKQVTNVEQPQQSADVARSTAADRRPISAPIMPTAMNDLKPAIVDTHIESTLTTNAQVFNESTPLKQMITECLDDLKEELRADIRNLHVEMIRQFELQQQDLINLVQQLMLNQQRRK